MTKRVRRTDGGTKWHHEAHVHVDGNWWDTFLADRPEDGSDDGVSVGVRLDADLVEEALALLPDIERDAIELCLEQGKRQIDVAEMLTPPGEPTLTQPAVSYMLKAAIRRLRYAVWLLPLRLSPELVRETLLKAGESQLHADVAAAYFATTSYSEAARRLMPERKWGPTDAKAMFNRLRRRIRRRVDQGDADPVLARVLTWLEGARPLAFVNRRQTGAWRAQASGWRRRALARG